MGLSPEKFTFPAADGHMLAARLDRPAVAPKAFALFAHCFTCSKDVVAAARIAGRLVERGIAVLRFDFTGLGGSEGEFANTNFSSNVRDLLQAVDYLREHHAAPALLIGHSLGGAAVLIAAGHVPEAKGVVTIGAPADVAHVIQNFAAKVDEVKAQGMAQVTLAGRTFTIKKQFLDDLERHPLRERVAELRKALLIFHSPRDEVVGIENASEIFLAAKHPKSFVSLDDADHLLTRRGDANYVADVIGAWASRYLNGAETASVLPVPGPQNVVSAAETLAGKYQQEVVSGAHRLFADEPASFGGMDSGLSPYDFLSAGLAACTSMTLRIYAERKGLPLGRVKVHVRHQKVHAEDCEDCGEGREGRIDRFQRQLEIEGDLTDDQRQQLVQIADRCPVHKTLEASSAIVTRLKRPTKS